MTRRQAEQAFAHGSFSLAASSFERAWKACPTNHNLLLQLSEAHTRNHAGKEAIASAHRFLVAEPSSILGKRTLANAYFMAQQLPQALQTANDILNTNPDDITALKIKGNVEYLLGHSDAAVQILLSVLDKHPADANAAYMLGRIYYGMGRIDQAMGQFQRVLKVDGQSFKALDNLGLCYQALGETETAKRYFLTAIKLGQAQGDPYDWPYANLADLLLQNDDPERAWAAASEAADRNPTSARNFYLGGKALERLHRDELSANWLERSASLDPTYAEPLYLLAQIYKRTGKEEQAAATLEKFRSVKANASRVRR